MKEKNLLGRNKVNDIFTILSEINPNPKIELEYANPFTLLIAVILSAQATDKMVNICTKDLFKTYDSPSKMLLLGYSGLIEYIKKIGLYKNKAKNILKTCDILIKDYNSQVPNKFDDLIKLYGVGRKTADVVLNSAFGKPAIAVDRHIFRIVHRIGIASGSSVDIIADELLKRVPKKWHKYCHHWLVLHGRHICKAQKPDCKNCPINKVCLMNKKKKAFS